jgi:hypothetical protein
LITAVLPLIVPAPRAKAKPQTKNTIVIMNTRLSMNGESPITLPVSGLRSGAPGNTVSSAIAAITSGYKRR